jgi:tetratricopeptide (TPR) repeat protein
LIEEGLHLLRQGRLREAEPVLASYLRVGSPDIVRAGSRLAELALRSPHPWKLRARWKQGKIGAQIIPASARRLLELELDLLLDEPTAKNRLAAWTPAPWSPEHPKLLEMVRHYLSPKIQTQALKRWMENYGGASQANEAVTFALGNLLEEQGLFSQAAQIYRDSLRGRSVLTFLEKKNLSADIPELREILERVRRTHRTPRSRRLLRQELTPDQNLGWIRSVRGWAHLAWVLQHLGETQEAEQALRQAELSLPPEDLRMRLSLAKLSGLLGRFGRAARLYQQALAIPPGPARILLQSLPRRGQVMAQLGWARIQGGNWSGGSRSLREAVSLGANLSSLAPRLPSPETNPGALSELAELPPSQGLGMLVASAQEHLGLTKEARKQALASLREGPPRIAQEALSWLRLHGQEASALTALRRRRDWKTAPEDFLPEVRKIPPNSKLKDAMGDLLMDLPLPLPPFLATHVGRLIETWSEVVDTPIRNRLTSLLPPLHRGILALALKKETPTEPPAALLVQPPDLGALNWWIELVMTRGWRKLALASLGRLSQLSLGAEGARQVLLARARLETLQGHEIGALLRGLRALEAVPDSPETLQFLLSVVSDNPEKRRILMAWAAHVDNDHRYALPLAELWSASARPKRALSPLLQARAAAPRNAALAARLGTLLQDLGKTSKALPHLLAAARLSGFRYHPGYARPLMRALASAGKPDRVLRLFRYWIQGATPRTVLTEVLLKVAKEGNFLPAAQQLLRGLGLRSQQKA